MVVGTMSAVRLNTRKERNLMMSLTSLDEEKRSFEIAMYELHCQMFLFVCLILLSFSIRMELQAKLQHLAIMSKTKIKRKATKRRMTMRMMEICRSMTWAVGAMKVPQRATKKMQQIARMVTIAVKEAINHNIQKSTRQYIWTEKKRNF